ncbi:histidine kinase [Azoarcus sp. DD4]|uniref:trifunctional serine/threonine-protein kinase/ATP-binding protein/sensor histidine kinase n=1 Tax=Azoarcus sp. DD4 TaxID=2027405 RepID=UPI001125F9E1|nr:ATP-binding protein [Azoarcus sp. DD4]QDF98061.1 histidine kinase [Azoarcus sp. DD4]
MTLPRSAPVFDYAWLARAEQVELYTMDGVSCHRLFDPLTRTWWFARSACLVDSAGCEQLQHEARLAPRLQVAWAAVPVATIWTPDRMVMVLPADATTQIGCDLLGQAVPIGEFLELAIGAAQALAELHAQGLLHGDVRPHNLLIDADHAVRLTGFGYAVPLEPEPRLLRPGAAALPYLAPELGRDEALGADTRTDLYALGISLYAFLTGSLPYGAESPAAWLHAHVAVEPPAPRQRRPEVPAILGELVLKLMAKDPGARYVSAGSALADLGRCLTEWTEQGRIAPFLLDAAGAASALAMPGQLFGRVREMTVLNDALARVRKHGRSELVLLAGAAGMGKSALVEWLEREAERQGARVAVGKSDQLQPDMPYAPVAQAIRMLTMGLLGEDEATLADLRQRWLDGLAGQGRAVVELVPEVEHVFGRTVPLSNVPAPQAQARLENAVLQTLAAFTAGGRPLLLFFDDLQWGDASTIALLEAFVGQPPAGVLLICAYRDKDAALARQLAWLLHAGRVHAIPVTRLALKPLGPQDLTGLIAATLDQTPVQVEALAHAVHRRTGGNPFFATQLLRALVDEGVLARSREGGNWHWDGAELARRRYADDVIDLMIRRFSRLPRAALALLQQLACVGIRCDEDLLARIAGISPLQLRQRLRPCVDARLLIRDAAGYAFQHDRVLESAYSQIPVEARVCTHARIAGIMIAYWGEQLAEHAFEIGNQIERAVAHDLSAAERVAFVQALIVAGRCAKRSAAIGQATRYVEVALSLMAPSWWTSHYALAYGVDLLKCECLLAEANLAQASDEIDRLLTRDLGALDRAAVHRLKASLQTVRSDYEGAINAALSGLALLGVHLRRGPGKDEMRASYEAVKAALGSRPIASLGSLPATADPRIQTVMGLLSTLISSLFVTDGISFLHVAKMVELTLAHGATPESPYGLSWFGVFIASLYDEYEDGLAYGLAAMALIDRHGYEAERIATLVAVDQVSPWTRPLAYALGHAQRAVTQGQASGDIGMACYARNHIASDLLAMGEHLRLVEEEIERGLALTRLIRYRDIELILNAQKDFVLRLGGGAALDASAQGEVDVARVAARLAESNSQPTRFWIWLYDGMASAFRGDWAQALHSLTQARALTWSAPAHINVADCHLFLALATAHADPVPTGAAALAEHHERFVRWAVLNPATFQSKRLLVEAECARLRGDALQALVCYEQSAHAAAAAGFVHEQALAHELAGLLCEAQGLHTAGRQHLSQAHAGYRRWGADHKAARLAAALPHLALDAGEGAAAAVAVQGRPDWALGIRAAQAMSGELVMDRLVETLMTDIVVHAGAQYGLLLLMRDCKPVIEASGRVVGGRVVVTLGAVAPTDEALPLAVLNSVLRTREPLVLADAAVDAPSIRQRTAGGARLRSVLCLPLLRGGVLIGIVYLENNLAPGVFDSGRIAQLAVLAPQVAISLETARLYEQFIDESNRRLSAELSLQTARAELARTSHLTVMGSLAASIAHEVNQPLTAIVASADASLRWLKRATPDIVEALDGLAHIKQDSLRAADIIRALRSLAKQAPAVLVPLAPDDVLRDVLGMLRIEIDQRNVKVLTRLEAGTAAVEADRVQLQQVVLNLVTNALDAMAQTPDEARELAISSSREREHVVVSIEDNGAGIPDEAVARIFDPFFTTKAGGMGMGLAICRSIIEAHGGSLAARPRDGGGSVFVFRLPLPQGGPAFVPP